MKVGNREGYGGGSGQGPEREESITGFRRPTVYGLHRKGEERSGPFPWVFECCYSRATTQDLGLERPMQRYNVSMIWTTLFWGVSTYPIVLLSNGHCNGEHGSAVPAGLVLGLSRPRQQTRRRDRVAGAGTFQGPEFDPERDENLTVASHVPTRHRLSPMWMTDRISTVNEADRMMYR